MAYPIVQIVITAVCVALSAFFSASESAIFSLSHIKAKHMLEVGRLGSISLNKLKDRPQRALVTILIGNNVVNIGASVLAASIATQLLQSNALGIAAGVMTFVIIVFGEIIPKSIAVKHNEAIAPILAPLLLALQTVMLPLVWVFDFAVERISGAPPKIAFTEEELLTAVNISESGGEIKKSQKEFIQRIFKFDDTPVSKIATPLPDVFSVSESAKVKDIARELVEGLYSRVPVYRGHKHNLVGILFLKDAMDIMRKKATGTTVKSLMQKPLYVQDTVKVNKMLRVFQKNNQHMAVVVDEHGVIHGIVTLEDVMEEIVGEIADETDEPEPSYVRISSKSYRVSGNAQIAELNRELGIGIEPKAYFDTVAGFIAHTLGRVPKPGTAISGNKYKMQVLEIKDNAIVSVKLILK